MTSSLSCIAASVKVRDFGAIVDDGSDDGPAIRLAIADLKSKGGGNLIFENGRYDIKSTANGAHLYKSY
jgi:polygalacturonase